MYCPILQVLAISLEVLKGRAFAASGTELDIQSWSLSSHEKYVNFAYWITVQEYQLTVLAFLR